MAAMVIQVFSLMWMRTTINYQYRHGGTMVATLKKLYAEGGIARFYRGLLPALVQGPLSRFGDTAANAGMLALLDSYEAGAALPIFVKTVMASGAAAGFRIVLMPVDALKTTLQARPPGGATRFRYGPCMRQAAVVRRLLTD
jgi:Mitochondrial carrier protein